MIDLEEREKIRTSARECEELTGGPPEIEQTDSEGC